MAWKQLKVILMFLVGSNLSNILLFENDMEYDIEDDIEDDIFLEYKKNYLEVTCSLRNKIQIGAMEPRPIVVAKMVRFTNCRQPSSSYAEVLKAFNVNVTAVQELILFFERSLTERSLFEGLEASHFKGLNIQLLNIEYRSLYSSASEPKLRDGFLLYLTSLIYLKGYKVYLPPFPADSNLVNIELNRVKMTEWGGCSKLQKLEIYRMDISKLSKDRSKGWLAHCRKLSTLCMEHMDQMNFNILKQSLQGLTSLVTLKVISSNLVNLPKKLFAGLTNLKHLDFSFNLFTNFKFEPLPSLLHLDLSNNRMNNGKFLKVILENQKSLVNLSLSGNNKLHPRRRVSHLNLERLHLAETGISYILNYQNLENLTYLDLSRNRLKFIRFKYLPLSRKPLLEVNLQSNPIEVIKFTQRDYELLRNRTSEYGFERRKVHLLIFKYDYMNLLKCDCEHAWLSQARRENLGISWNKAVCADGKMLEDVSLKQLECDLKRCNGAATSCKCRRRWQDQTVDADCHGAELTVMPREENLRSVRAPYNHIKNVSAQDFPDTLLEVDLSDNQLTQIDPITLKTIFNVSSRRLRLAGNPFTCDCDHQLLIETLQQHQEQVEDLDDIKCLGSTKALNAVDISTLCVGQSGTWLTALLVAGGVFVSLLVFVLTLYYRFEYQLKMLLFAHGCLFWVRQDDLDADRPYDVFLSFSHGDVDFVVDELLPGLEDEPYGYKVCVHFRDWVVGDWIPAQITRSVEQSRRTVIVLSENFLTSIWGVLEFRTAHEIAVTEGRRRIIVIALDDAVNNDEWLDSELRTYLRNNTYLHWGDKWFWSKLRYALPHRHINEIQIQPGQDCAERVGIQLQAIRNSSTEH